MITPHITSLLLLATLLAPAAHAANPMRGQLLYRNFCYHCHMTEIHFRVDSSVNTWGALVRMVAVWQEEMKLGWRAEEILDVASYLNRLYYRFEGSTIE